MMANERTELGTSARSVSERLVLAKVCRSSVSRKIPREATARNMVARFRSEYARHAGESDYERHRLELGAPGPADWGEDNAYPLEADFDLLNGVDFQKGCFVGQETTSRMKRRGQVKTRMLPIVFDGPPPAPGTEVLAGELRAGEVRSGIEGRAMALLRLDRIAGPLAAGGRPVRPAPPAWLAPRAG